MTSPIKSDDAMPDDVVVSLEDVSVNYRIALEPRLTLKESFIRRRRHQVVDYLALNGLSISVRRGETFGIIGGNGAGKTTLLNVVARIIHPSSGRLRIRGTVVPLIDLVSGFHPELTGRENAYLRGAFLGVSRKRMRRRIDEIAAFADIGQFFDAALRTYSVGMIVRLAFAVITSLDADIFVVDEALGVGDAEFQLKCAARIAELRERGGTFIVVSHDLPRLAALSHRIMWLDHGRMQTVGEPRTVVAQYQTPSPV
jgi:ABC-type polysaccharide/polyol phosphate transport system ATPase subunit